MGETFYLIRFNDNSFRIDKDPLDVDGKKMVYQEIKDSKEIEAASIWGTTKYYCIKNTTYEYVVKVIQDFYRVFFDGSSTLDLQIQYSVEYIKQYFPQDELEKYNLVKIDTSLIVMRSGLNTISGPNSCNYTTLFVRKDKKYTISYDIIINNDDTKTLQKVIAMYNNDGDFVFKYPIHDEYEVIDYKKMIASIEKNIEDNFLDVAKEFIDDARHIYKSNIKYMYSYTDHMRESLNELKLFLDNIPVNIKLLMAVL